MHWAEAKEMIWVEGLKNAQSDMGYDKKTKASQKTPKKVSGMLDLLIC